MVVHVTYRVPVGVELEIETGEITNVHIMDEKLEGPLGVFDYELVPIGGRLKEHALELVERPSGPAWTFGYRPTRRPIVTRLVPDWSFSGPSSKRTGHNWTHLEG